MDCWEEEETELELKLCCASVKKKRRYSCSPDSFNASSCETVSGISESLDNSNNNSSVSADPMGELKEQDLISCLMKSHSNSMCHSFVNFNSDVDCTLSLGMPHTGPSSDEIRVMAMFKQETADGVIEIFKSILFPPKVQISFHCYVNTESQVENAFPNKITCNIMGESFF